MDNTLTKNADGTGYIINNAFVRMVINNVPDTFTIRDLRLLDDRVIVWFTEDGSERRSPQVTLGRCNGSGHCIVYYEAE